jgi:hypothetical protein
MSNTESLAAQHHEVLDLTRRVRVLMVVANPFHIRYWDGP